MWVWGPRCPDECAVDGLLARWRCAAADGVSDRCRVTTPHGHSARCHAPRRVREQARRGGAASAGAEGDDREPGQDERDGERATQAVAPPRGPTPGPEETGEG